MTWADVVEFADLLLNSEEEEILQYLLLLLLALYPKEFQVVAL